jgi:DivIVA domain-containing protein
MALTPEDVVNKRFQPTKFREGYDQDEVDDFLDEVVVELRRLNQETEELRQRLIASDSRISELQRSAAQPAPAAFEQTAAASAPAPVPASVPAPAFAGNAVEPSIDPSNTNNLLQLARRLHEEHVREGVEKRDALIAEGQTTAARVTDEAQTSAARVTDEAQSTAARVTEEAQITAARVTDEAQTTATRLTEETQANVARLLEEGQANAARALEEAQERSRTQISALDQERSVLEGRIEELRNFEREYRSKLKDYISGQLRELESPSAVLAAAPVQAAVGAASAPSYDGQGFDGQGFEGQGFDGQNYGAQIAPPAASYPGFAGN